MRNKIYLYDTTLRDGTQREGISLSLEDKVRIARRLDHFGVHYIEGGWPGSNPKDAEFFEAVRRMTFQTAKITAFGSTRRKNVRPEDDPNLQALLASETPAVALVGKSWDLHVRDVLETDLEENLAMIAESVAYMKANGKEVIYDAEHFFDGYKANPEYALLTLKVAAEAGADVVVPCDTNGGSLPWEVSQIMKEVVESIDADVGIHTHDDGGCGVANTLAAVQAGAIHVQGTINGYGERVGNANLSTIIPDLQVKMGKDCVPGENLAQITELSRFVAEVANLSLDDHSPYVGSSAFAHKGGIHVAAMRKNVASYQHIMPELVGNQQRTVISELAGRGNVLDKATEYGVDTTTAQAREVLQQIKELEAQGFAFESAEASMSLMLYRLQPGYQPPFELLDFTVLVQHREERGLSADATIKVRVGDRVLHTAAEGNGPVNALDAALRKALLDVYPRLAEVNLSDYKV
ncbi:MAG: citramalate synthase, partial [Candidatus Promineifilaceae bacterium]